MNKRTITTFFKSDVAKKLLSALFGFGLATIIRPICNKKECTTHKLSKIDPTTIFKNKDSCMTFDTNITECTGDSIPIDTKFTPKSNFNVSSTDKLIIGGLVIALYIVCKLFNLSVPICIGLFLISVVVNMYLGPVPKINQIHPTPFNLLKTYKTNDTCFEFTSKDTDCTPDAQPIPLQL